jgi:hypothetical protein
VSAQDRREEAVAAQRRVEELREDARHRRVSAKEHRRATDERLERGIAVSGDFDGPVAG